MTDELIVCQNLYKRFPLPGGKGEFTALSDVSLTVRRGEVLALLGRSGAVRAPCYALWRG
jgi:ABC-type multidrug transport system ATPase subunit